MMPVLCLGYRISKPCGFSTVTMLRESAVNSSIMRCAQFSPSLSLILRMRSQRLRVHRYLPWSIFRGSLTSGQTPPLNVSRFSLRARGHWCARQRSMPFTESSSAKNSQRFGNTLSIPLRRARHLWRNRKPSLSGIQFLPMLKL